jgi:hypothetical protein
MVLMVTRPASGPAAAASWLPSDRVTGLTDVMLALLFDPGSAGGRLPPVPGAPGFRAAGAGAVGCLGDGVWGWVAMSARRHGLTTGRGGSRSLRPMGGLAGCGHE